MECPCITSNKGTAISCGDSSFATGPSHQCSSDGGSKVSSLVIANRTELDLVGRPRPLSSFFLLFGVFRTQPSFRPCRPGTLLDGATEVVCEGGRGSRVFAPRSYFFAFASRFFVKVGGLSARERNSELWHFAKNRGAVFRKS